MWFLNDAQGRGGGGGAGLLWFKWDVYKNATWIHQIHEFMLFDFKNVRMKGNFIAEQTSLDWKENQIKRFSERQ